MNKCTLPTVEECGIKPYWVLAERIDAARAILDKLMHRAWMRNDLHEADELADLLGVPRPSDHERADL